VTPSTRLSQQRLWRDVGSSTCDLISFTSREMALKAPGRLPRRAGRSFPLFSTLPTVSCFSLKVGKNCFRRDSVAHFVGRAFPKGRPLPRPSTRSGAPGAVRSFDKPREKSMLLESSSVAICDSLRSGCVFSLSVPSSPAGELGRREWRSGELADG